MQRKPLSLFGVVFMILASFLSIVPNTLASDSEEEMTLDFRIESELYTLTNGLRVVLSEDHRVPTVAISVYYDVGSRNEIRGRSGFAHLFEHMMFQGSENVGKADHFKHIANNGGIMNGNTTVDRTAYFEVLPSNQLALGLWLESDRMRSLKVTQENFENQRETVKEERRSRYDNQPYTNAFSRINELAFNLWEYGHSTIGSMADLEAAQLEDVLQFFNTYYIPNNAVLVIVGDFNPEEALKWVRQYFESIPRGPSPPSVNLIESPHSAPRREIYFDPIAQLPALLTEYNIPPRRHPDHYALDVAGEILLGGDTSSRLYQKLVKEKQVAIDIRGGADGRRGPDLFTVEVTTNGASPRDVEKWVQEEIERLKHEPVLAVELARVKNRLKAEFIFKAESNLEKSNMLAQTTLYYGNPEILMTDMQALLNVSWKDVQRVANTYFVENSYSVMEVIPGKPENLAEVQKTPPPSGLVKGVTFPDQKESTLQNGLKMIAVEMPDVPTVYLHMAIKTGSKHDPKDLPGLTAFTSELVKEGTKDRSSREISEMIEGIGAKLNIETNEDFTEISLASLSEHLDLALDLFADIIQNATFPSEEVEQKRQTEMANLKNKRSDPKFLAKENLHQMLYGSHPYAVVSATENSLANISRDDLVGFHQTYFVPNNATLIIAGDVQAEKIFEKVGQMFKNWALKPLTPPEFPRPTHHGDKKIHLVDRAKSVQAVIYIGDVGVERAHSDFIPLFVTNYILGGGASSRLFMNLREQKGYTYGAYSMMTSRAEPSPIIAQANVRTEVTEGAMTEFFNELERIATQDVTQEELENAKAYLTGVFPIRIESAGMIAKMIAQQEIYKLPKDYWATYRQKISQVTVEDVKTVAQKYIVPNRMAIVVVGIADQIKGVLEKFGTVEVFDVSGNPIP